MNVPQGRQKQAEQRRSSFSGHVKNRNLGYVAGEILRAKRPKNKLDIKEKYLSLFSSLLQLERGKKKMKNEKKWDENFKNRDSMV